jgi:Flp pilus assembly protein TadG
VVARDRGQAAVEFALAMPVVMLLVLGIVQLVVVARGQLAVELAAREGARAAAVAADPAGAADSAANAAIALRPLNVATKLDGDRVTVTVSYEQPTDVALIGTMIGSVTVESAVTMQLEPP